MEKPDASKINRMLKIIVGSRYGERPIESLSEIRAENIKRTGDALDDLRLEASDRVLDLGCGCGWASRVVSSVGARYWGVDLDPNFIAWAREETEETPNLSFHSIEHGDLSGFRGLGINKVFALNVFSQFNLYDFAVYLKAVRDLLDDGFFYFNFMNAEKLNHTTDPKFLRHLALYREDRSQISKLLQWHSPRTILGFAETIGFRVEFFHSEDEWVMLRA